MSNQVGAVSEPRDGGSPQQGAAVTPGVADGVADKAADDGSKPIDLSTVPEFQQAMRSFNQKLDSVSAELQRERELRLQLQQQYDQQVMDRLPEGERTQYQLSKLQAERDAAAQELAEIRAQQAREGLFRQLSQRSGIPYEDLAQSQSPDQLLLTLVDRLAGSQRGQDGGSPNGGQSAGNAPSQAANAPHTPFVGPGQNRHEKSIDEQLLDLQKRARTGGPNQALASEYVKMLMGGT